MFDFPAGEKQMGMKGIVFRPGEHKVDLYESFHSERLPHTTAPLYLEDGLPTIKITLDTYKLAVVEFCSRVSTPIDTAKVETVHSFVMYK
jgi:hypothetical protein